MRSYTRHFRNRRVWVFDSKAAADAAVSTLGQYAVVGANGTPSVGLVVDGAIVWNNDTGSNRTYNRMRRTRVVQVVYDTQALANADAANQPTGTIVAVQNSLLVGLVSAGSVDWNESSGTIWDYLRDESTNAHVWSAAPDQGDGKFTDTPKGYTAVHGTRSGVTTTSPHTEAAVQDALDGFCAVEQNSDTINVSSLPRSEISRNNSNRTLLVVFDNNGNDNNFRFLTLSQDAQAFGFVWANAGFASVLIAENPVSTELAQMSTSYSHTDGGASEALRSNESGRLVVAMCWNATTSKYTIRWKGESHARTGHSFRDNISDTKPGAPSGNISTYRLIGHSGASSFLGNFEGLGIFDIELSDAQFNAVLDSLGMSGT